MRVWVALLGAVAAEVVGSLSLKVAIDQPGFYGLTAVAYLTAFVLLSLTLRWGMPLGVAYGVWGALGVAATALMSTALFGEALTPVMGLGLGMIVAGVLVVELGAQQARRRDAGSAA